ncbi:uncharacterized protein LOC143895393 [Temnothorax americanus]|uniref:uncharacterized protein LOC143895393 n=1 Tax=Temnothorax americanus TaxID=1964332 RepID=UPI004067AE8A
MNKDIRSRLERLSLGELQEEARTYGLMALEDRQQCLKAVVSHLENNGPFRDFENQTNQTGSASAVAGNAAEPSNFSQFRSLMLEQLRLDREEQSKQNREMMEQIMSMINATPRSPAQEPSLTSVHTNRTIVSSVAPAQAVTLLASQLSKFNGTEDEDVTIWLNKVENVARIHGVTHEIALLAATSKLGGNAQRWFEHGTGIVNRSYIVFKEAITRRFKRKTPMYVQMRKIEKRQWNFPKEPFMNYAMDKINLMQSVTLPDTDKIQLIINGIANMAMRGTATALDSTDIDQFLDQMHRITSSCMPKKNVTSKPQKGRDFAVKKDNQPKVSVSPSSVPVNKDKFCGYCKTKGHVREECFKLKRKEQSQSVAPTASSTTVSAVDIADTTASPTTAAQTTEPTTVACVAEQDRRLELDDFQIKVIALNKVKSDLVALVDTGSPISFVRPSVYKKYFESSDNATSSHHSYKALNNSPIQISGTVSSELILSPLPEFSASIELNVLLNDCLTMDLIIGMDFIKKHKIKIMYNPTSDNPENKLRLFNEIAFADVIPEPPKKLEEKLSSIETDFDDGVKQRLISVFDEVESAEIPPSGEKYLVRVALKDESVYAYSPRRVSWKEREQTREITDDLPRRGIIKPSSSPYCARTVLVRKKMVNGVYA